MKKKKCSKCAKEKEVSNFHKNASKWDGYQNNCKECQIGFSKSYYDGNSELVIKKQTLRYQKNMKQITEKQYQEKLKELRS